MNQILKDALKSSELQYNLEEIIAVDDKIDVEAIPAAVIIAEAKYVLGKFTGESGGFEQADDYRGENGPEQQAWARKEVAALRRLLRKYDDSGTVRQVAIRKAAAAVNFASGQVVSYGGADFRLDQPAGPRLGWIVKRVRDGKRFRLKSKQLAAVTFTQI